MLSFILLPLLSLQVFFFDEHTWSWSPVNSGCNRESVLNGCLSFNISFELHYMETHNIHILCSDFSFINKFGILPKCWFPILYIFLGTLNWYTYSPNHSIHPSLLAYCTAVFEYLSYFHLCFLTLEYFVRFC